MASRIEKTTRRVAGRVRKATKSAATATRRASDVMERVEKATRGIDSRSNAKKVGRAAKQLAKSAVVGAATMGLRSAVAAIEKKLARARPKPTRGKKALKVAGAVAVMAGAAMVARKIVKSRRARASEAPAMEPEGEMERGPEY